MKRQAREAFMQEWGALSEEAREGLTQMPVYQRDHEGGHNGEKGVSIEGPVAFRDAILFLLRPLLDLHNKDGRYLYVSETYPGRPVMRVKGTSKGETVPPSNPHVGEDVVSCNIQLRATKEARETTLADAFGPDGNLRVGAITEEQKAKVLELLKAS